jgi:uncharacterized protein YjiS (DUF1127 family)
MFTQTITSEHPWPYRTAWAPTGPTLWARSRDAVAQAAAAVARWHRAHRDAQRLMVLNDRMLRDVGLSRGDVERAVWHGRA